MVADEADALLDHLCLDRVHVVGGSGGSSHSLAFAALYLERVRTAAVVVGAAPVLVEDIPEVIELNRAGQSAAHDRWEAMHRLLAPVRADLLRDSIREEPALSAILAFLHTVGQSPKTPSTSV